MDASPYGYFINILLSGVKMKIPKFKTLEREFTYYKFKLQYTTVKAKIADYYRALEPFEVHLSGIYYRSPEQRAQDDILHIIKTDVNKFHSLYEKADKSN